MRKWYISFLTIITMLVLNCLTPVYAGDMVLSDDTVLIDDSGLFTESADTVGDFAFTDENEEAPEVLGSSDETAEGPDVFEEISVEYDLGLSEDF
ncbi:MAG: hypothetical protein IKX95_05250, partial [Lachnospiraceae bacterium]|nr:hypothetical protein [Lachnospiraceae bacterium]